jgi:hypothetical protein
MRRLNWRTNATNGGNDMQMPPYANGDRFQNHFRRRQLYRAVAQQSPAPQQDEVVVQTHMVSVMQSIELLRQLVEQANANTWLTLEGDLSRFNSGGLTGVVRDDSPTDDLAAPLHSRVTIPLSQENVQQLKTAVLPHVGVRSHIVHLTLECNDRRLFAAHNRFRQCTLFGGWLTSDFLRQLQHDGVIEIS